MRPVWSVLAVAVLVLLVVHPAQARDDTDPFAEMTSQGRAVWAKILDGSDLTSLPPLREVEAPLFTQDPPRLEVASRDRRVAGTRNGDLYMRNRQSDEITVIAKARGPARWTIEDAEWSPDGRYIAAKTIDDSRVPLIRLNGSQFGPTGVAQVPYSRLGQPLLVVRVFIVDTVTGSVTPVRHEPSRPYVNIVGWRGDSGAVRLLSADRYQRRLDLLTADPRSGSAILLHTEAQPVSVTSLNLLHGYSDALRAMKLVSFLGDDSFVWLSDRSGFQHLYLHAPDGRRLRSISKNRMAGFIDSVLDVDPAKRRIFARAAGFGTDPYAHRIVRIDIDQDRVVTLAEAGHIPQFKVSADRKRLWLYKTSFPDHLSIEAITDEGQPFETLWRADWRKVNATGYVHPEVAFVHAADGRTPIRAVIVFPPNFNPKLRYPVIHHVYGGPQRTSAPLSPRNVTLWEQSKTARSGFIVVTIDGRGTPGRGRDFQNHSYGRFGQVEAGDQIAGLRALAATRPYMDLKRVGIMGGSWGGYFGLRTALTEPDLYKAGVFWAGAYEMARMRVAAEPFIGCSRAQCPASYTRASNLAVLHRLKAPVLLMHGTADNDVPIEESLNLVRSLRQHGKPHELVEIHGWTHSVSSWPEFAGRMIDFFERHLGDPEEAAVVE